MEYELRPIHSNRKSFYGKAFVIEREGRKVLRSYQTEVAYIENGQAVVKGNYSNTTSCHIKEFLLQNGFHAVNGRQWLKDYPQPEQAEDQAGQDQDALGGMMKALSMVCAIGQFECKTIEEQNKWDLRMIKASGLPLDFPPDFDTLPEEEKARRLAGVKELMKDQGKAVA
jgi:hypothetical protein